MIEWILSTNPATIQGWIVVLTGVIGLAKWWIEHNDKTKWDRIREIVPQAHRLAQKASKLTETKKDDLFVEFVGKLLGKAVEASDVEAVKLLGSAEHQDYKLALAASDAIKSAEGNSEGGN